MLATERESRFAASHCAIVFALLLCRVGTGAQIENLTEVAPDEVSVLCTSDLEHYYLLLFGSTPSSISEAVDIRLGDPGSLALSHVISPTFFCGFYRVLEVPLQAPQDTDHDGFNDLLELRSPHVDPLNFDLDTDGDGLPDRFEADWGMDPLGRDDAFFDYDGDGLSNTQEFERTSDPFTPEYINQNRVSVSEVFAGTATLLAGHDERSPGLTFYSPPVLRRAVYAGIVTAVERDILYDASASFPEEIIQPRSFSASHATMQEGYGASPESYSAFFESGLVSDVLLADPKAHTLILCDRIDVDVMPGEKFTIRPNWSLSSIFRECDGLFGGRRGTDMEQEGVRLCEPPLQVSRHFLSERIGNTLRWYDEAGNAAGDTPVRAGQGLEMVRTANTDAVLYLSGVARTTPIRVRVSEGESLLGFVTTASLHLMSDGRLLTDNRGTGAIAKLCDLMAESIQVVSAREEFTCLRGTDGKLGWLTARTGEVRREDLRIPIGGGVRVTRGFGKGVVTWLLAEP